MRLIISIIMILSAITTAVFAEVPPNAPFKKVFIVVFENENADDVLKQPTFADLARDGAYMNNFHAVTHPSQPNYIALTSGDLHGVPNDENVDLDVKNITDLLEAKGLTWKVYVEDFPGQCNPDKRLGKYVRKHNPFISYNNIRNNPKRCAQIVPATQLQTDITAGKLPDYSFYVPNLDNDGHDTGIAFADAWLRKTFIHQLINPAFMKDMLFIITFDEGKVKHPTASNQIYTLFLGDMVEAKKIEEKYDFYNMLRTIEDAWGLGTLEANDAKSKPITGIWKQK